VFRSALRGDRDETDVLALTHQGRTVLARVDVRRKEGAELELEIRDAGIFHDSRRAASETLAEDDAERFFSLFSQLQSWLSLL